MWSRKGAGGGACQPWRRGQRGRRVRVIRPLPELFNFGHIRAAHVLMDVCALASSVSHQAAGASSPVFINCIIGAERTN